ncbi:MAG: CDP-diacylglycerol--glycerol-3-phosphate 3-phosphatidyltransferase [bacterium]|nr:CDP-diacylglycerol--glycerol-3-phosphate 3-phosphatidyltransferase [bacterium]
MNFQFTLPNVLTLLRLCLTPVLAVILMLDSPWSRWTALGIVIVCELTDALDGFFARRWNQVSDFGKLMDPLADSMYRDTVFICMAVRQEVSIFLVLPILYRDSLLFSLRMFCALKGIVLAARASGKIKAVFQAICIVAVVVMRILEINSAWVAAHYLTIVNGLMALVMIITVASAIEYYMGVLPKISEKDELTA